MVATREREGAAPPQSEMQEGATTGSLFRISLPDLADLWAAG